jgi:hypothetical protein
VVLSIPETAALLGAMSGTPRLMAWLIYGGAGGTSPVDAPDWVDFR